MDFSDYNSKRKLKKCIDKDTFLFFKHLQRAAAWCEAVMQDSDHPLGAAFVNPGLAVAKDGYPPLTGCRFRSSSDLTEWSACPTREVVPRIFVFSIWYFQIEEAFFYSQKRYQWFLCSKMSYFEQFTVYIIKIKSHSCLHERV